MQNKHKVEDPEPAGTDNSLTSYYINKTHLYLTFEVSD
jgi:hypothetical protein